VLGLKVGKRLLGPILTAFGIAFIIIGILGAFAPYPVIPNINGMVPGAVLVILGVNLMAYVFLFVWKND
jgi:hypothetical protein